MAKHDVAIFKPYPFKIGQKIRIEGGRRAGDWEVADVKENKITLRCPLSGREFEWNKFCYIVQENRQQWPVED